MDDAAVEARIARNEVVFRRVNEAREAPDEAPTRRIGFVCECGRLGCTEIVEVTRDEYEAVRTSFDRFLLLPGHDTPGTESVVEEHDHYIVVEKEGLARRIVRRETAS